MVKSKAGLTRKKVNVRTKSGKTIQRSMMVRSDGGAKKATRTQAGGGKKRGLLIGKTGTGTSFKHGLAGGFIGGAAGFNRMGIVKHDMSGLNHGTIGIRLAHRGMTHAAAHKSLKAHGQQGRSLGQKIKHFAANEVGQMVGNIAGHYAHEAGRKAFGRRGT